MLLHTLWVFILFSSSQYGDCMAFEGRAVEMVEHESTPLFVNLIKTIYGIANDVSNPNSPSYGNYLSATQLRIHAKHGSNSFRCHRLAQLKRCPEIRPYGEWISFQTTVAHARELYNATFAKYSYKGKPSVLRTQSYSIPHSLEDNIDFIFPATQFLAVSHYRTPTLSARQRIPTGPPSCDSGTCPSTLQSKYNITYTPPDNLSGSRLAIAGFLEGYPSLDDLHSFLNQYGLHNDSNPYNYTVELVNGGKNPENVNLAGVEAMLDLEYTMPFTYPLNVTYISTGGRPPTLSQPGNVSVPQNESQNEPYLEFLEYLLTLESPPQVISISYSDDEQSVPQAYAQRVCDLFARLATRGVSVLVASGDGAVQGTTDSDCQGPDGQSRFIPTFPSSCPWITSVGATAAYGGPASYSSGGFSNYFARPSWQDAATQQYITQLNGTHDLYYNKSGRGFPDVSLLGNDYLVVSNGYAHTQAGTSASTPVVAAMITLINDIRLRAGKPVLGFLNPLLYANGTDAIRDVTTGFGDGCANKTWNEPGWDALPGWDPIYWSWRA